MAIGGPQDGEITAILGSCVAVCLWDQHVSLGGMNHILLPDTSQHPHDRFGAVEMERLVNALVKRGAERHRLEAKVFGGASMLSGLTDIGERNSAFALGYLASEGIPVRAHSTGGTQARQVRFMPGTGHARQRFVPNFETEKQPMRTPKANGVELF
ncbi:MAG: chemotaxis protein CheD [Rhodobacteraceae bacterium]|nr:chemotaxis protein CheD [Paracoccaceae bacterium]